MSVEKCLFGIVLAVSASLVATRAPAQVYPVKPIRIIVPFTPGGGADVPARLLASAMQPALGQQIVVENRPGGNGTIGTNAVAKAAPDGYTILATSESTTVHAIALYPQLPYDPAKELVAVSTTIKTHYMLIGGPGWKGSSLKDLIEAAKASPGKLTVAMAPNAQFAFELFKVRSGLDLVPVIYKGGAPAVQDVLGGIVPLGLAGANSATALAKEGKLRVLAVTSRQRAAAFPDTPALSETLTDYEAVGWGGIWAPAGTPRDILIRLNAEISRALASSEIVKRFGDIVIDVFPNNLDESAKFWRSELAIWPDLIRKLGITAN